MAKEYGLSFPKQGAGHQIGQISAVKPSVFDIDSDSEEQTAKPTGISRALKKQDLISQEKAVADDPTVYQYDEVYEEIEKKRNESKLVRKNTEKKPKYITKLLAAAEKRKRENDRRIERQVQKEREEEGDEFKDKESFITPSYKKKLEEMKQLEEQEKREEYLESIGDVRKQGNLDGFYRHLYDQKINYDEKDQTKTEEVEVKEEILEDIKEENLSEENEKSNNEEITEEKSSKFTRKRKYRSKRNSDDSGNEEEPEVKKEHLPSNIDADSDFSVDSSDSDEETNKEGKKDVTSNQKEDKEINLKINESNPTELSSKPEETIKKEKEVKIEPKKVKIDIWKKRTVGEKFDDAVKRYFERKAIREMGQ